MSVRILVNKNIPSGKLITQSTARKEKKKNAEKSL